jgi:hypothetical protein
LIIKGLGLTTDLDLKIWGGDFEGIKREQIFGR